MHDDEDFTSDDDEGFEGNSRDIIDPNRLRGTLQRQEKPRRKLTEAQERQIAEMRDKSPQMQKHLRVYTDDDMKRWFEEYVSNGMGFMEACRTTNIPRNFVARQIKENPVWEALMLDTKHEMKEMLEKEALRRAVQGVEEPIMYKGVIVARVKKYSDNLLLALLRKFDPEGYRDREVKHSGRVDVDHGERVVVVEKRMSVDEWKRGFDELQRQQQEASALLPQFEKSETN